MIETDSKKLKQAEWYKSHTLTQEQLKQLIAAKFARAAQYREAVRKREALVEGR